MVSLVASPHLLILRLLLPHLKLFVDTFKGSMSLVPMFGSSSYADNVNHFVMSSLCRFSVA
jgi:hypothetical protein